MAAMREQALVAGTLVLTEIRRVQSAIEQDWKHGTTRNLAEAGVGIVTATKGAIDGFAKGAQVGAFFGAGAFVCGVIGAVCGAVSYSFLSRKVAISIFDQAKYGIKLMKCQECGVVYECRVYTDQSRLFCPRHDGSTSNRDFKKVYTCVDCSKNYTCSMDKSLDLCPRCKEDDDPGYYGSRNDYPNCKNSKYS